MRRRQLMLGLLPALLACAQPAPPETPENLCPTNSAGVPEIESLYPLVDGATWTYDDIDPIGMVTAEEVTVTKQGDGVYLLADAPNASAERTEAVIERIGSAAMRTHKDVYVASTIVQVVDYDPGFMRMDDAWTEVADPCSISYDRHETNPSGSYTRDDLREHSYQIVAVDEEVTVPAGTFQTIHVLRTRLDQGGNTGEEVEHWYAAGVGKVREERIDRSEELRAFNIPGGQSSP